MERAKLATSCHVSQCRDASWQRSALYGSVEVPACTRSFFLLETFVPTASVLRRLGCARKSRTLSHRCDTKGPHAFDSGPCLTPKAMRQAFVWSSEEHGQNLVSRLDDHGKDNARPKWVRIRSEEIPAGKLEYTESSAKASVTHQPLSVNISSKCPICNGCIGVAQKACKRVTTLPA